jgi:hypothetical protein
MYDFQIYPATKPEQKIYDKINALYVFGRLNKLITKAPVIGKRNLA